MHRTTSLLTALVLASVASIPGAARADSKAACADAYGKAQSLRDAQKLLSARDQLRICARPTCTQFIARDCATWLGEIESRVPSVVLFARDGTGADIANVTVSMDGSVIAEQLDGHAIEVDAGRHAFVFVLPEGKKLEQSYVVLEGQKAQRVGVTMAPLSPVAGAKTGGAELPSAGLESGPSSWSGWKTAGLTLGIAGLAGLGVGSYFGVAAMNQASQQTRDCPDKTCGVDNHGLAINDHSNALTDATVSTIAFAAGGALVATGIVMFLVAPKGSEQAPDETRTSFQWAPVVAPGGGGLWLRGSF